MENKAIGNQMIGVSVTRNEKNKLKSFFSISTIALDV